MTLHSAGGQLLTGSLVLGAGTGLTGAGSLAGLQSELSADGATVTFPVERNVTPAIFGTVIPNLFEATGAGPGGTHPFVVGDNLSDLGFGVNDQQLIPNGASNGRFEFNVPALGQVATETIEGGSGQGTIWVNGAIGYGQLSGGTAVSGVADKWTDTNGTQYTFQGSFASALGTLTIAGGMLGSNPANSIVIDNFDLAAATANPQGFLGIVLPESLSLAPSANASEIPPLRLFGPGHRRLTPHIYSMRQLRLLIAAARELHPPQGLRGETCATIIGLIAACGLRISEATGLRREDVDLQRSCLHIRYGKSGKSRLVPIHPSTRDALRRYARLRDRKCAGSEAFFVFDRGREAATRHLHYAFAIVRQALRQPPRGGHRKYRLHDARHTFVCRRLERWYQQGIDVDRKMLALSTYIGHASPADTYWYVTATPRLMALAAQRLEPLPSGGVA